MEQPVSPSVMCSEHAVTPSVVVQGAGSQARARR
jgi:hypothetical protein